MNQLQQYVGKCVHFCQTGRHVLSVHTLNDVQQCDFIEDLLHNLEYSCSRCDDADTGTDAVRGYIK